MLRVDDLIREISKDILILWKKVLSANELGNSDAEEDTTIEVNGDTLLLSYNDYLDYIDSGRKKFEKKIPVDALVDWARKRGIPTDNNVLYAIREAIYKDGISPRPIFKMFEDSLDDAWDENYADLIYDKITDLLDSFFKNG